MEQAERGTAARSQNVIHFLPRTTETLTRALVPALERIDAGQPFVQLVVVTPDAESAIAVGEAVHAFTGAQGIEVVPVTAANRAARILADRPIHAVAGPAIELRSLIERSALKLDHLRTIVLAWPDDDAASAGDTVSAVEAVFADVPKETSRILLARRPSPATDQLIEQHMRSARRMSQPEAAEVADISPATTLHYVSVTASSRPAALRRLLDELDPPSVAVVVRDPAGETDAAQTVRSLGYRRADDPIRVARYDAIPASHTVILYDAPVMPSELASATAGTPVQVIALATPRDLIPLHELGQQIAPLTLEGPAAAARSRESRLRTELAGVLAQGTATRELLALEPLLDRYDGIEIAAAALRLLEAERNARAEAGTLRLAQQPQRGESAAHERPPRERQPRDRGTGDRPFRDRPPRDRGASDRPSREHGPRDHGSRDRGPSRGGPEREFRGPPRGARPDRGERTERSGSGERRERNLGRGPRSGGQGRDDRDRRPSGPPRRPRPFER